MHTNVRAERVRHNWSQRTLSRLVDVAPATVHYWEVGHRRPTGARARKLVEVLGRPLDELLSPETEKAGTDA